MTERSRVTLVLRLGLLLGLPVAVIGGLFCVGVWIGARNGEAVRGFERDVLGLKIPDEAEAAKTLGQRSFGAAKERLLGPDKPSALGDPIAQTVKAPGSDAAPGIQAPATQGGAAGIPPATGGQTGGALTAPGTTPPGGPADGKSAPEPVALPTQTPVHPATVDPLDTPIAAATPLVALDGVDDQVAEADLAAASAALKKPRRVAVKLLVERAWVQEHPGWIDDVQRLMAHVSADFVALLGVEFEVHAIAVWEINSASLSLEELHAELRSRSREDADILIGIATKTSTVGSTGLGDAPITLDDLAKSRRAPEFHGAYAVVLSSPGRRQPHLHTLLHELGHLLGATDIDKPDMPGWTAGSIMSYIAVDESLPPTFDAINRQRMLLRKHLPFVTEDQIAKIKRTPMRSTGSTGSSQKHSEAVFSRKSTGTL